MLFAFGLAINLTMAQTQKQASFSFEDGWKIEKLDINQPIEINLTATARQNLQVSYENMQKMEDHLVQFSLDKKSNRVFMHLATDKEPKWTDKEWSAYLLRRHLLVN
jgi:hypothetical protein